MMDPHYEWKNWLLVATIDYFIWILTTINCCFLVFCLIQIDFLSDQEICASCQLKSKERIPEWWCILIMNRKTDWLLTKAIILSESLLLESDWFLRFLAYSNGFFVRSRKLCKVPIEIQREDTWTMMDPHYEWKRWLLVAKIDYFIRILTTINWLIFTISVLFKWIFCPIKNAVQGANWSAKRGHLTHDVSSLWMEELSASCQNRLFYQNPNYYKLIDFYDFCLIQMEF